MDVALDTRLLRGFRYACRPDCGLCCYAEPRVEPRERSSLLRIAPAAELDERPGGAFIRARPDGGACQFLTENRCRVWGARPGPCRQFPLAVHLGERLQVDLVLTCPGVDLAPLLDSGPWEDRPPGQGFATELAAAEGRRGPALARRIEQATRRHRRLRSELRRTGRWQDEEDVRRQARDEALLPTADDFPAEAPPPAEEGLEFLPLFFDGRPGPVALAEGLGGWACLELHPDGGAEPPAMVPPPTAPLALDPDAARMVAGYLRYFLERDSFLAQVVSGMAPYASSTVLEETVLELRAVGAQVVSRADVIRRLHGVPDAPLSLREVAAGIRATDQDLLDRPGWGDRL